jgi:hypothetical protein
MSSADYVIIYCRRVLPNTEYFSTTSRMATTVKVYYLLPHSISIWLIFPWFSLTVGSAIGAISDLFAKIKAIDAKHGKFDFVLCTGDFFGPLNDTDGNVKDDTTKLLAGELEGKSSLSYVEALTKFPIKHQSSATSCKVNIRYLVVSSRNLQRQGANCVRTYFFWVSTGIFHSHLSSCLNAGTGKSGIVTTANGLRIACLGGTYDSDIYASAEAAPVSPDARPT